MTATLSASARFKITPDGRDFVTVLTLGGKEIREIGHPEEIALRHLSKTLGAPVSSLKSAKALAARKGIALTYTAKRVKSL